jgi:hypothetical protein
MPPVASIFVVFRKETSPGEFAMIERASKNDLGRPNSRLIAEKIPPAIFITQPWKLAFPEGWGAPASILLHELSSWTDSPDPGVQYFSGTAAYTNSFTIPEGRLQKGSSLVLDLGKLKEVAEVFINGKSAGILWKEPFRTDITRFVKAGDNTLEITVTNLWNNRIVGDLQPDSPKAYARTNIKNKFKANTPLIASGLLGPVKIVQVPPRPSDFQ